MFEYHNWINVFGIECSSILKFGLKVKVNSNLMFELNLKNYLKTFFFFKGFLFLFFIDEKQIGKVQVPLSFLILVLDFKFSLYKKERKKKWEKKNEREKK